MNYNLYWSVYKNLERELIELSNMIHVDDKQLEIYSIKIAELLIRTVVEIEAISKELYYQNGGTKPDNNELFFDTDCIDLLENKWLLSKKQVQVIAPNFYFNEVENKELTPFKKANKRGTSSSDWQKAYQAVKHNRAKSLSKGNLKHLIHGLAALFVLNLYYNNNIFKLGKDSKGITFNSNLGSSIFSVKLHISTGISPVSIFSKNPDFDECIYLLKPTSETGSIVQEATKMIDDTAIERTNKNIIFEIEKQLPTIKTTNLEELQKEFKSIAHKLRIENMKKVVEENSEKIRKAFEGLEYEAVLNKQQY